MFRVYIDVLEFVLGLLTLFINLSVNSKLLFTLLSRLRRFILVDQSRYTLRQLFTLFSSSLYFFYLFLFLYIFCSFIFNSLLLNFPI